MAFIGCPNCQLQISELAAACPRCAHPMAAAKNRANTTLLKVAGSALMFLGSGMAFFGGFWWRNGIDDGGTFAWGLILFVAGMMTFVAARFRE